MEALSSTLDELSLSPVWAYGSDVGALCLAIIENDVGVAAEILRRRPDLVNYRRSGVAGRSSPDGSTFLHDAARNGAVHVAAMLLDAGAEVDAVAVVGGLRVTPLELVGPSGYGVLPLLLAAGADPDGVREPRRMTLLCKAAFSFAYSGFKPPVEALLRAGACPDGPSWSSPLLFAADFGGPPFSESNFAIAKVVIAWGAHVPAASSTFRQTVWYSRFGADVPPVLRTCPRMTVQEREDSCAEWRAAVSTAYAMMPSLALRVWNADAVDHWLALLYTACCGVDVDTATVTAEGLDWALAPSNRMRPRGWVRSFAEDFTPDKRRRGI